MPPLPPPTDQIWRCGRVAVIAGTSLARGAVMSLPELQACDESLLAVPRRAGLLPYRHRSERDDAERVTSANHRQIPLPPLPVTLDGGLILRDERGIQGASHSVVTLFIIVLVFKPGNRVPWLVRTLGHAEAVEGVVPHVPLAVDHANGDALRTDGVDGLRIIGGLARRPARGDAVSVGSGRVRLLAAELY